MHNDLGVGSEGYYWYTLRVFRNEERCVTSIKEHIELRKLQSKISEVKLLKEYQIVESEEYSPSSDDLPRRGFKSTDTSVWVRISNGNYKKIRIVEKKPFSGMIFIKMAHDTELFKMIRSWDAGFSFLGGNQQPQVMSEADFRRTEESLSREIPDLRRYIKGKNYLLVEGPLSAYRSSTHSPSNTEQEALTEANNDLINSEMPEIEESMMMDEAPAVEETIESRKAQIYSDLQIKEYEGEYSAKTVPSKSKAKKSGQKFSINDFVFVAHLGFKGVIQEIDYDKDHVVVGVQMFGRRQPVECKISEIFPV